MKGFLQSFFIVAILLSAAVVGYQITLKLWSVEVEEPRNVHMTPTPEPITVPSVDDISKNLIYCYDEKDHRVSRMLLEVFNCQRKELAYITIPINTKLTMSDMLYRKLIVIKPEIPQIIKFSTITRYLDKKTVFDYGVLMAEELLDTDISYYTVIPEDLFTEIFEERVIPASISIADYFSEEEKPMPTVTGTASEKELRPEPTQVFTSQFNENIKNLDTEAKIKAYLEELYSKLTSNLPWQDKVNYIECYSEISAEQVIFLRLAGKEQNSGFEIDPIRATRQLQELTAELGN